MAVAGDSFSRMAAIVGCANIEYNYPSMPRQFRLYRARTNKPIIGQTSGIIDLEQPDGNTNNIDRS